MGLRSSSYGNVHIWLDHSNFVGVSCGWDFTAEHEWGIKVLRESFGIDQSKAGLPGRTVTKTPYVGLDEIGGVLYLWHDRVYSWREPNKQIPEYFVREVRILGDQEYNAGWGEESFCFAAKDAKTKRFLAQLHEAFAKNDVAIYLGGRDLPVFSNAGLILAIASRIPFETANHMKEVDEDAIKLKQAAKDTGIEEKLKAAGKGWFALSPRWTKSNGTKHPVAFWLNPMDQQENNYGWFTVEELELWIENKGPIPMTKKQKRQKAT